MDLYIDEIPQELFESILCYLDEDSIKNLFQISKFKPGDLRWKMMYYWLMGFPCKGQRMDFDEFIRHKGLLKIIEMKGMLPGLTGALYLDKQSLEEKIEQLNIITKIYFMGKIPTEVRYLQSITNIDIHG